MARCVCIPPPVLLHEKGGRICGEKTDEDGCGGEEKERKTEVKVDRQCKCGLEGEGTVGLR